MNKQRGFSTSSILLVILLGVALVGGGAYYTLHQNTPLQNPPRDYLTTQIPVQPPTTPVQQKPTSAQTNITIIATVNHFTFELPKGWTSNGNGINPIKLTDQSGSVVATVAFPQRPQSCLS